MTHELIAAVDLGSNSFRLQVGRVVGDQIYPLDSVKEAVRLAEGITPQKTLDGPSQLRALDALRRFGERLRGFDADAVRAVGTNSLRVAKNANQFLVEAEAALGFPIEIIAGREEARLIYVGVAHTLPNPATQQLVVDIGGGSTEFIIGKSFESLALESLYMGCVSYSIEFFGDGRIDKKSLREAELAARKELQTISRQFKKIGWEQAVGSSGTAKAICDMIELAGYSDGGITREGLEMLKARLLKAGDLKAVDLPGLRPDRVPVIPGGLAIMSAVFEELGLERMRFSEGALRLGVLYDLLGRYHHHDLRDATMRNFMRRYEIDDKQAQRVADTALALLRQASANRCPRTIPTATFSTGRRTCMRSEFRSPTAAITSTVRTSWATPTCRVFRAGTRHGWRGWFWRIAASCSACRGSNRTAVTGSSSSACGWRSWCIARATMRAYRRCSC